MYHVIPDCERIYCIYYHHYIPPLKFHGVTKDERHRNSLAHFIGWVILITSLIIDPKFKLALFFIVQGCFYDNHSWTEMFTYSNFWYAIQPGDGVLHHLTYNYSGYFPKYDTTASCTDSLFVYLNHPLNITHMFLIAF